MGGAVRILTGKTPVYKIIWDYLNDQSEDLRYLSLNFFIRKKTSSELSETRADLVTRNRILQNWE